MKILIIISMFLSFVYSIEKDKLQFSGVSCKVEQKELILKRNIPEKCKKMGITPEVVFGENLASESVPDECKKTFVSSLGTVQPISLGSGIKTVAEIEVLQFYKLLEESPEKYALVDSRTEGWFKEITLPKAINVPYPDIAYDKFFPEEFKENLSKLNVTGERGNLNFSKAKTIIIFCNGIWCSQSAQAIEQLLKLGYPARKIFWYRGGVQDWSSMGFQTIRHR